MSLFSVCLWALVFVFALLVFLSAAMRLITELFPLRDEGLDPAIVAAVSTAVATVFPGVQVTKMEEES
jgi:hypothetical protein